VATAEFNLCLPSSKPDSAEILVKRIYTAFNSFKATLKGEPIRIAAEISACIIEKDSQPSFYDIMAQCQSHLELQAEVLIKTLTLSSKKRVDNQDSNIISIDKVLSPVEQGRLDDVTAQLDKVMDRIWPLITLLNKIQRQQLMTELTGMNT